MREYRLYTLDGAGRITQAHEISASSDEDALAIARELKLTSKCELWERDRRVAIIGMSS